MKEVVVYNKHEEILNDESILKLIIAQMEHIGASRSREKIIETLKVVFDASKRTYILVIKENKVAKGFAFFNICTGIETGGDYIWLNELHVKHNERGKGYGKIVLAKLEQWASERNIKKILGIAYEDEDNVELFYEKAGFNIRSVKWLEKTVN